MAILAALAAVASAKLPPEVERGLERLSAQRAHEFVRDQEMADFLKLGLDADEPALVGRVLGLPPGYARTRVLRVLGSTFAERSQPAALAYLASIPAAERPPVAESVYRSLGARAFAEAKASLAGLPDDATRDSARLALATLLAKTDAKAAEAMAQGLDDKLRARVWRQIGYNWSLDDVRGFLRWVDGLGVTDVDLRVQLINNLAFRLCASRPDQALALLPMFPDEVRPALCGMLARRMASANLPKALAWMSSLTEQADRSEAFLALADAWAESDPESARAAVVEWPDPEVRPRLHGIVAHRWAAREPGAALAWARTLEPELREDTTSRVLNQMALANPAPALRALMSLPPGPERDRLAERLVSSRPGSRELAEWSARYPDPATARRMTKRAVFGWCLRLDVGSLDEAESWVLALEDVALREDALVGALDGTTRHIQPRNAKLDPDIFVRLVASIGSASVRQEQAGRLADLWRRAYPDDPRRPFARFLDGQGGAEPKGPR